MKRWAGGEHVQEQAGESGTAVKGSSHSGSSEPGGSLQHNGETGRNPSLLPLHSSLVALRIPFPRAGMQIQILKEPGEE